jgi:hypothetical protein
MDRYGPDVLADFSRRAAPATPPPVAAERGLVVETLAESAEGFVGAVVGVERSTVSLEDRHGRVRVFPLGRGFLVEGRAVTLVAPSVVAAPTRARTASGSFASGQERARVAVASRLFVEGRHDAELVEKVWGHDLRAEGVVVELLQGVDELPTVLAEFSPGANRRAGVLVDHLVAGSKESRIADAVARGPHGANVLVVGHPFIDVWEAVRPRAVGIRAWPNVPRGVDWKHGVCEALGWPHESQADIAAAWQRILSRVTDFTDLEPALLGPVERLIDFVTEEPGARG